jgi:1-aminocyclopropane-1-carboxylate deaminase/D-cysteine desulfhydrase-like pyridoxal-dependent ACC family enzyme
VCALTPGDVLKLARSLARRGNFWIPPGGSNVLGTLGYLDALLELEQQVRDGLLPEPDLIFVALGSGGTAAGLLAGLALSTLRSRIVAIPVMHLPMARALVTTLAARALRVSEHVVTPNWSSRLELDARWIGKGYGFPTQAGESAIEIAAKYGLSLESTYTGKAFAAALEWLRWPVDRGNVVAYPDDIPALTNVRSLERAPQRALFWSTISTTKDSPTDSEAVTLSPSLARLLRDEPKRLPRN